MTEEATAPEVEAQPETPTETGDAEAVAAAPETSPEGEPTDESDAVSEPALEAEISPDVKSLEEKLAKAEKKLAKTTYEQRESRRQSERLISMLEKSQQQPDTEAPKVEDFESLDEYVAASVKHQIDAGKPKETSNRDPAFEQKRDDLFFEGQGKYEDFAEKATADNIGITPIMADAIFELDDMDTQVELTYFLANNQREAHRISRLTPLRQAAEIGKLEAKLSAPKTAKRQPSTAPAPIKPVGGAKTPSSDHNPNDSFETFKRKRNKELGR